MIGRPHAGPRCCAPRAPGRRCQRGARGSHGSAAGRTTGRAGPVAARDLGDLRRADARHAARRARPDDRRPPRCRRSSATSAAWSTCRGWSPPTCSPSTAATPLWGKLGDQYGRKRLFQTAIVIFLIGSALCGIAQNMAPADRLPRAAGPRRRRADGAVDGDRRRHRAARANAASYQGLFGAVFGATSVLGPLLGGLFTDHLSLALGLLHQPADRRRRARRHRRRAAHPGARGPSAPSTTSAPS